MYNLIKKSIYKQIFVITTATDWKTVVDFPNLTTQNSTWNSHYLNNRRFSISPFNQEYRKGIRIYVRQIHCGFCAYTLSFLRHIIPLWNSSWRLSALWLSTAQTSSSWSGPPRTSKASAKDTCILPAHTEKEDNRFSTRKWTHKNTEISFNLQLGETDTLFCLPWLYMTESSCTRSNQSGQQHPHIPYVSQLRLLLFFILITGSLIHISYWNNENKFK